jgi:hypothetical protein
MRINMDHWVTLSNIPVRRSPHNARLLHVEPDRDIIAGGQAERFEIGGRNIELDVPECVDPQHAPTHSTVPCPFSQWDEERAYGARIEYRSKVLDLRLTRREHGRSWTEDISASKCTTRRRQLIQRLFEGHDTVRATNHGNGWCQEPIVRANEIPDGCTRGNCSSVCANSRVNDREKYTIWHELNSPGERHCTTVDVSVSYAVGDIDDSRGRSDTGNHAVHHTDELILVSEVTEKRDWNIHSSQG